ncbi:MAG TPA: hypothetical protein VK563_10465 [Puia sp.]|nr:hypothetical protein [Puia sp.]
MELEEMKSLWGEMSVELEKQKKLTDSLIIRMTKTDYRNKLNKILIPEAISSLGCFAGVAFILIDFQKLNTWYLMACGITSVLILFLLPVLSIKAIRNLRSVNISENNIRQSLLEYAQGRVQFVFVQKLSFYLGCILMLVILPVMGLLIAGKDLFTATRLWLWYAVSFPFFYGVSRWVLKCYIRTATDAENMLKELES